MRCFCRGLIAVLVLVAGVAAIPATAGAQQSDAEAEAPEVRIVARRLESGRVEFAMQHLGGGGEWGERTLPSRRFFPTTARVGRWLHSSSLSIDTTPATELRIVARRLESGGLEFGLERRGADGEWGEQQLPRRRFLPSDATVGRWLASSVLTVGGGFSSTEGRRGGRSLAAVSNGRTCVVRPAGDLLCWGRHGRRDNLSASLLDGVAAVALGQQPDVEPHSCALHANGRVSCWG
ncbi:MAG: RCC1 domain-containing protein, partial [bacterium]|nr:RCC1 domain-containing protein [bacterium]